MLREANARRAAGTVLVLSRYDQLGASSRVRLFKYLPWLRDLGLSVDVQCLLSDAYLKARYDRGRGNVLEIWSAYVRRVLYLLRHRRPDVIWLEKELWPFLPFGVERPFLARQKYVVDIDDAVFHNYDEHALFAVRQMLGDKIDSIFRSASLVTAGSRYLAQRALDARASRVEVVPTVVRAEDYQIAGARQGPEFIVGWIGSPVTQAMLEPVVSVLEGVLAGEHDRFVTIGSMFREKLFPNHEQWAWHVETEAQMVAKFDVGIMPLTDTPFERGKCGYKLIQYMACGLPVVASPVGANLDIVRPGENGFLAGNKDEWRTALLGLKQNFAMRRAMGDAGRKMVRERYCLEVMGPKVARWLADLASDTPKGLRSKRQLCAE